MGTLANGIKDIFSTSRTTATHLPVCANDGTPQGRISVGDLASVLGVIGYKKEINTNNTPDLKYLDYGTYNCGGAAGTAYYNNGQIPFNGGFIISCINGGGYRYQVLQKVTGAGATPTMYTRTRTSGSTDWSNWSRIDNYGTSSLSELASALKVGGITDSCYFNIYTAPANGSVKILNVPIMSPSTAYATIFALIGWHYGGNSFVDVLVSHSGNLRVSTIVGNRPSYFSYNHINNQINLANSDSIEHEARASILVFGGTIAR